MRKLIIKTLIFILACSISYAQTTGYAFVQSRSTPVFLPSEKKVEYPNLPFQSNMDLYPIKKNVAKVAANAIYIQTDTTVSLFIFKDSPVPELSEINAIKSRTTSFRNKYFRELYIFHELNEAGFGVINKGQTSVFTGTFDGKLFYTIPNLPLVYLDYKDTRYHYKRINPNKENTLYDRIYSSSEPASTTEYIQNYNRNVINNDVALPEWKGGGAEPAAYNFISHSSSLNINNRGGILLNNSYNSNTTTNISGMQGNNGHQTIVADLVTYSLPNSRKRYGTLVKLHYIGKKMARFPTNSSFESLVLNKSWLSKADKDYLNGFNCSLLSKTISVVMFRAKEIYPLLGNEVGSYISMLDACPCPDETCGRPPR